MDPEEILKALEAMRIPRDQREQLAYLIWKMKPTPAGVGPTEREARGGMPPDMRQGVFGDTGKPYYDVGFESGPGREAQHAKIYQGIWNRQRGERARANPTRSDKLAKEVAGWIEELADFISGGKKK